MNIESYKNAILEKYNLIENFEEQLTLEDFKELKIIGEGRFAKVFKCSLLTDVSVKLPEFVAIKVMNRRQLEKLDVVDIALHEMKLLKLLSNNFIIDYYTSFSSLQNICIVLEWVPLNLFSILRSKIYFGEPTARFFGSQICLGLEYLHNLKIAYRDLKPENVLVRIDGGAKITDMSFAKCIDGRTYTSNGTVEYMAPEVIMGEGHGVAVDWWAFGVLLYEMCAGHSPFVASSILNLMKNIIKVQFKFPSYFSEELKELIRNLLTIDVTKRLGNMKNKINDIKNNSWFDDDVEWEKMEVQCYRLPKEIADLEKVENYIC